MIRKHLKVSLFVMSCGLMCASGIMEAIEADATALASARHSIDVIPVMIKLSSNKINRHVDKITKNSKLVIHESEENVTGDLEKVVQDIVSNTINVISGATDNLKKSQKNNAIKSALLNVKEIIKGVNDLWSGDKDLCSNTVKDFIASKDYTLSVDLSNCEVSNIKASEDLDQAKDKLNEKYQTALHDAVFNYMTKDESELSKMFTEYDNIQKNFDKSQAKIDIFTIQAPKSISIDSDKDDTKNEVAKFPVSMSGSSILNDFQMFLVDAVGDEYAGYIKRLLVICGSILLCINFVPVAFNSTRLAINYGNTFIA